VTRTIAARLMPGDDLLDGLVALARAEGLLAPAVVTCVGSLARVSLRMAGADRSTTIDGVFEIVSLVGTLSPDGAHLHVSISDEAGTVSGGHLLPGSIVRTTAEVVLVEVDDVGFRRVVDPATGWDELVVEPSRD
jgi:uncharacterized protein